VRSGGSPLSSGGFCRADDGPGHRGTATELVPPRSRPANPPCARHIDRVG
jgi:hypothetical protein